MHQIKEVSSDTQTTGIAPVIVIEILEHNPGMAAVKTVIRKTNQGITSSKFSSDDAFSEHTSREEILMHLAFGHARILIDGNIHLLNTGESLKVPANSSRKITEGIAFTIITTDIKGLSI